MQWTAAVIGAGSGDITFGLQRAGFEVAAAYEEDPLAASIHTVNSKVPLFERPLDEISPEDFPNVDLIAGRFTLPAAFKEGQKAYGGARLIDFFFKLLSARQPRAFLVFVNSGFLKSRNARALLEGFMDIGYAFSSGILDICRLTGFPVKESLGCIAGIRQTFPASLCFPASDAPVLPAKKFLQLGRPIDDYYFRLPSGFHPDYRPDDAQPFLCWKNRTYLPSSAALWNTRMPPLVWDDGAVRKITHREIANLKGFPAGYAFPLQNKRQLYQLLMYAKNIHAVCQIARTLSGSMQQSSVPDPSALIEALFGEYLQKLLSLRKETPYAISSHCADFTILRNGAPVRSYWVKYYAGSVRVPSQRAELLCEKIAASSGAKDRILIFANQVEASCKARCFENYGVAVWDVENILYLFRIFPDIKNRFISVLSYSVDRLSPKKPVFHTAKKEDELSFSEEQPPSEDELPPESKAASGEAGVCAEARSLIAELAAVKPGQEQYPAYEAVCKKILQFLFGSYLTLWAEQTASNDGLYRFDLCCRIKSGMVHDFFDTIKNYFTTKYIVFEFKNYTEPITQREIYTTEKYLYEKALRKVAILLSRKGPDVHAVQAIKGALRESGKLMLCLSDQDLLNMMQAYAFEGKDPADKLEEILDKLLLQLEK